MSRLITGARARPRGLARALAACTAFALATGTLATPAHAEKVKRASKQDLEEAGLDDPRSRQWPRRHRLRLVVHADWVRLSSACGENMRNCTRFHYAPLMLEFGYQVQFLRVLMFRPAIALGGNVANSRNAMPAMIKPSAMLGFQHKLFGIAAGYSYTLPFPTTVNATDNFGGVGQPVIWNQHAFDAELSFTSRIHRTALTFAVTFSGLNANLLHFDLDRYRWFFRLGLAAGFFFDLGKRRERRRAGG